MTAATLTLVLLEMAGNPHGVARRRIAAAAPVILEEATTAEVDPVVLGAVLFRESGFSQDARGALGEVGMGQILPRGIGRTLCADLMPRIRRARENVRCAARVLAWAQRRCGGSPVRWVTAYNAPRRCGPTKYSRRIVLAMQRTKGAE